MKNPHPALLIAALVALLLIFSGGDVAPPVPPGPTPTPDVDPTPDPQPAPLPGKGNRVLIWWETAQSSEMPIEQLDSVMGTALREWFDDHDVEWRIWDQHVDAQHEDKDWREAATTEHPSLPWLLISNGRTGYSGPLPQRLADTLQLLEEHID